MPNPKKLSIETDAEAPAEVLKRRLADVAERLEDGELETDLAAIETAMALLDGDPRSATATALEPCELLVIQRRDLIPFLERHPKTAIKLLATLTGLVRNLSNQLEDRVFLGLPGRLAKKLLALADNYGKDTADGILIDLRMPQGELGEMVGTSRESVNKQLQAWRKQGLLRSEKLYITILDREALEDLAGTSI